MSVRIQIASDLASCRRLESAWATLASETSPWPSHQPFWAFAWLARPEAGRPWVTSAWEGDELVGLAVLEARRVAGLRLLRGMGHGEGGLGAVLTHPEGTLTRAELLEAALGKGPAVAQVLDVPVPAAGASACGSFGQKSTRLMEAPADACPITDLARLADEETWWRERSSQLRKATRRGLKLAERERRPLTTSIVRSADELDGVLPELVALLDAAERERPLGHHLSPTRGPFTLRCWRQAARDGHLRLALSRVDGELAGYVAAYHLGNQVTGETTRFHPAFSRFSPGSAALRALFRAAFADGAERLSLGLGRHAYKRFWCDDEVATADLVAWSAAPLRPVANLLADRAARGRSAAQPAETTPPGIVAAGSELASPKL